MAIQKAWQPVRNLLAQFSPRRRRWERFLRELPLDPAQLQRPLAAPPQNDFIICGSPRTGTTLVCAQLFQPPQVVTVMEPWDGMRLPPAELFASLRQEITSNQSLSRGKLDLTTLQNEGKVKWTQEEAASHSLTVAPDYILGVKWPAYWQYLDLLPETRFLVCVRNPIDTIHSFKKAGGQVARGLQYTTRFNQTLNQDLRRRTDDERLRRIYLYDTINEQVLRHLDRANVFVVRYEEWFTDPERMLSEIGGFLGVTLHSGLARIRAPKSETLDLPPEEIELIRQHCRTAKALGYDL